MSKALHVCLLLVCFKGDTGQVAPPAAPIIKIYSTDKCFYCRQEIREFERHPEFDPRISKTYPRWIDSKLAAGEGFPFTEWATHRMGRVYYSGWGGWDDFRSRYERSL